MEPELVYFQAAAPIATALAAGAIDVGATGLTAALYNIVLQGEKLWIVADKGREWPGFPLVGIVVQKELWDSGKVRSIRDLKGRTIGVTQLGSTFHYPHRQYPREGRARARRRAHRAPAGHAGDGGGAQGQAGGCHPGAAALPRRDRGPGLRQGARVGGGSLLVADRGDLLLEAVRRGSGEGGGLHEGLRQGLALLLRRRPRPEGRPVVPGADYDEVVEITAHYTGAKPENDPSRIALSGPQRPALVPDVEKQIKWWVDARLHEGGCCPSRRSWIPPSSRTR